MKKTALLTTLAALLLALSGTPLRAQDTIVGGTNLRVGWPNTLGTMGGHLAGNAIGHHHSVGSDAALAVGAYDTIDHQISGCSVALGSSNRVTGASSFCAGDNIKLAGQYSFGAGRFLRVSGQTGCMVLGTGIYGPGQSPNLYLENHCANSLAVGFFSTAPTLFVGPSPNDYSLGVTDRTGRVAIGNVTPSAKLHIRSDEEEDAELVLEPGDCKTHSTRLTLHDSGHHILVTPNGSTAFHSSGPLTMSADGYRLQGGRLDLGDAGQRKLTLTPSGMPAVYCNAYRDGGIYRRHNPGSSYALEFRTDTLLLRASANQGERGSQITNWCDALSITTDGHVTLNGQVGINTANTTRQYALAVDGGMITTKARIQEVEDWPDRVFAPDYPLRPMDELREYVAVNRHLPGVPSEEEVSERGIDVGSMQAVLLEKIEELTLYILRQQQDIERLTQYNLNQRSEIDTLKKELEELRGTVRFGYDACGNRVSRTLEVKREDDKNHLEGGHPKESDAKATLTASCDLVGGMAYAIYPNPTEGRLVLVTEGTVPPEGAVATLLTLTGSVMEERVVRSNREELDLSGRPSGVYLLRLSSGGETHIWKVIKGE